MGKKQGKFRKVLFTDTEMFLAQDSGKFKTHRDFIEWLFEGQHKCKVIDFEKLRFNHRISTQKRVITSIEGQIGQALEFM